jgi:uncharacterized membrane protein
VSRLGNERPPTPEEQRDPKYWLGQLWGVWRKMLVFVFVGLGLVLLLRFGPGAVLILVPIGVLIFGSAIFAWARVKMRGKR